MSDGGSRFGFLSNPRTLPLAYHTVTNMRPGQLVGIVERAVRHATVPRLPVDFDERYEAAIPSDPVVDARPIADNNDALRECLPPDAVVRRCRRARRLAAGEVTFRNRTFSVGDGADVDWFADPLPAPSTLWGIQFHGFSFALWPVLGHESPGECPDVSETVRRLITRWDESERTDVGRERYLRGVWTPHAVSLRIINLARYYAWDGADPGNQFSDRLERLVYKQAAFLSNHVEHDVGGNHLVENGAALVVAGVFFPEAGSRWRRQGLEVLSEAATQFLPDGGHFEHSPMYHAQVLARYLTVVDLLRRAGYDVPATLERVATAATRYFSWLEPPDGRLPLLNDSAFGMALPLQSCLAYAETLGVDTAARELQTHRDANRYYWLGSGDTRLLVDGGAVGPPHLPAHSHNDHFSVLWWADGERVLTDTGTYEYLSSPERQYARSVAAHNTVQYGDLEPIPIGSSYLFGRRIDPSVRYVSDGDVEAFRGYYRRQSKRAVEYSHRRDIFAHDDWFMIVDRVDADEPGPVRSRLHFHPDMRIEPAPDADEPRLDVRPAGSDGENSGAIAHCHPVGAATVSRSESRYFPEFGRSVSRPSVTLHDHGEQVTMGYLLSTVPHETVSVERERGQIASLEVDGQSTSLSVPEV
jgi:uncharacterized heparinase superfamily protein